MGLLVLFLGHIVDLHPSAQQVGGLVLDELADVAVIPGTFTFSTLSGMVETAG